MVQCLLEVSLSPVRRGAGVSQGRGRRWPKKKPSGSDSEEEEQVGQGASFLGSRGVSRRPCACPWRASVWSPVRYSCSALDPRIPIRVSRLELTAVARRVAREMVAAFGWAQSRSPTLQSPSSPVPGGVRNAHLRAASLFLPDSGGAAARSQSQSGPNLPLRPEPCAPPPWVRSRLPPLPASAQQRAAAAPAQERVPRRSPNGGAGWVLEALGARRPGTRGESCGPRSSGLGGRGAGRGRCWRGGTAWDRGEGPSPGEPPPSAQPEPLPPSPLILTFSSLTRGRPAFQCRGRTRTRIRIATLKAAGAAGAAPRQGITSPAQGPGAVLAAEVIFVPALSLGLGVALGENQLREGEGDGSFIHSLIHSSNNHALYPVDAEARLQTFPFDLLKHSQTRGGLIGLARIPQLAGGTS